MWNAFLTLCKWYIFASCCQFLLVLETKCSVTTWQNTNVGSILENRKGALWSRSCGSWISSNYVISSYHQKYSDFDSCLCTTAMNQTSVNINIFLFLRFWRNRDKIHSFLPLTNISLCQNSISVYFLFLTILKEREQNSWK